MSETERLTYIHSGKCMDDLKINGSSTILEELTRTTQEKAAILFATPEAKAIGDKIDFEELFSEANTAIVRSYGLLHTIADSYTRQEFVIANANGIISTEILKALKMRVTDIAFQALGTTRIEHFQSFLEAIKEKGSVRVGQYAQIKYINGEYILRAVGRKRISHDSVDSTLRPLLAREPYRRAKSIKFPISMLNK